MYKELSDKLSSINVFTKAGQLNKQSNVILQKHPHLYNEIFINTMFLADNPPLRVRLFCIKHNITEQPRCKTCGKIMSFNHQKNKFNTYCPNRDSNCAASDIELVNQIKQTTLERYGVTNVAHSPEIQDKIKRTNLDRFGVEYTFQSSEIRNKGKQTIKTKYGVDHIAHVPEIRDKAFKTNIEKYGTKTYAESKVNHEAISVLADKDALIDYLKDFSVKDIAFNLNTTTFQVRNFVKLHGLDIPQRVQSSHHRRILSHISTITDETVLINDRKTIAPLELDICIPTKKLAIEINGIFFHSQLSGKDKRYHLNKTLLCNQNNIQLVHILSNELNNKPEIVLSRITNLLGGSKKIYARNTTIKPLDNESAKVFFNRCHIQGHVKCNVAYGLFHNDVLIAAASFIKSRFNTNYEWELLRYCSALNTQVIGGASKLFKYFIKQHHPKSVISYCDRRWGTGSMYHKIGFTHIHNSDPNYYYFVRNGDTDKLHSRVQFQKHKLKNKLEQFDPNLSEWQNMVNNGYDRIWDCGNSVWVWTPDNL